MLDIIKPLWFSGNIFLCWFLINCNAPYNPNKPNTKYLTVKNKAVARILIPKHNPWLKYVKVNDRNKLRLLSFIEYIILAATCLLYIILSFLPEISCDPVTYPLGRYGGEFSVSTYNEKMPLSLSLIFLILISLEHIVPAFISLLKNDEHNTNKLTKALLFIAILLFLFSAGYLFITII